jgi:beta-phosphoglucomutase-like phosphatase (HAD superfamily)
MDEARVLGLKISVCSAATKSSVVFCLTNLLGKERFEALDCFLAGDDVDKKKPDPSIYRRAAEVLGVAPGNCLVVEDSVIGLQVDHISTVHVMIGHFCYTNFSFAGPNSLVTLKVLCCSCLCNLLDITAGNLVRE